MLRVIEFFLELVTLDVYSYQCTVVHCDCEGTFSLQYHGPCFASDRSRDRRSDGMFVKPNPSSDPILVMEKGGDQGNESR
jgi:hypothetical protein